jgi:Ring finger domain
MSGSLATLPEHLVYILNKFNISDVQLRKSDLTYDIYYIQVCCICLGKYANNDELRELPCGHVFHKDCVDKWLKINALCPLCKVEVGGSNSTS